MKICGFIFLLFPVLFLVHFLQVHRRPKAKNHPGYSKHEIHFKATVKNLLDHKTLLEYHRSKDDSAQCFFHVNSNANKPLQILCGYNYASVTSTLQQYWSDNSVHAFSGEHEQVFFEGPQTMTAIEFSLSTRTCSLRSGFYQGPVSSETSDRFNAWKLSLAMSDGICPVGVSVAVGGKGLSGIRKGHSIECPGWWSVSSCFLFLLWS